VAPVCATQNSYQSLGNSGGSAVARGQAFVIGNAGRIERVQGRGQPEHPVLGAPSHRRVLVFPLQRDRLEPQRTTIGLGACRLVRQHTQVDVPLLKEGRRGYRGQFRPGLGALDFHDDAPVERVQVEGIDLHEQPAAVRQGPVDARLEREGRAVAHAAQQAQRRGVGQDPALARHRRHRLARKGFRAMLHAHADRPARAHVDARVLPGLIGPRLKVLRGRSGGLGRVPGARHELKEQGQE
jgi:hypothetical protein